MQPSKLVLLASWRVRLVGLWVLSSVLAGGLVLAEAPPLAARFDLILPPGQQARVELRPARDAALASFVASEEAPLFARDVGTGEISVPLPGAGSFRVGVFAEGYLPSEALLAGVVEPERLPPLRAEPMRTAELRILAAGKPVEDAWVLAEPAAETPASAWQPAPIRKRSNAAGLVSLPAGKDCDVLVAAPGHPPWRGVLRLEIGSARDIELEPGRRRELLVLDPQGLPSPGAQVSVDGLLMAETTSAAGRLPLFWPLSRPAAIRVLGASSSWASRQVQPTEHAGAEPVEVRLASAMDLALQVFDEKSLLPLSGALVWPASHPELLARSAVQGRTGLRIPWGGTTALAASAPEHLPLRAEVQQASRLLLRPVAQPGLRLVGRVEDASAQPVAGAKVELRPSPRPEVIAWSEQREGASAETDSDGAFTFESVTAQEVDLEVEAEGWAPMLVRRVGLTPSLAVPGLAELGTIVLEPGARVVGRVLSSNLAPLEGAKVMAREPGSRSIRELETLADGSFLFTDYAAGTELEIWAEHGSGQSKPRLVEAGGEAETLLVLEPSSLISGRVLASGEGVANALILVRSGEKTRASARSDEHGDFVLRGLKPGLLEVEAVAPGLLGESLRFELAAGESADDLELLLTPGGVVEGKVFGVGGEPLSGVRLELLAGDRDLSGRLAAPSTSSHEDGTYRLQGLPPGRQTLRARRSDLIARTTTVDIQGTGTEQGLDWQLEPGGKVAGEVVDELGRGVGGASIVAFSAAGLALNEPVFSDAAGRFELAGMPAEVLRLEAQAAAHARTEKSVLLSPGTEKVEVRMVFPPSASLSGRVLGASFEAISRAQVWATSPSGEQRSGVISYDGTYRVEALAAGSWRVSARVPGYPREASRLVEVEEGAEASLDLELDRSGYRLGGIVSAAGEPKAGILVSASSIGGASSGAMTRADGSFAIEALPAGTYQLTLLGEGRTLSRQVELHGDLDLALDLAGEDIKAPYGVNR